MTIRKLDPGPFVVPMPVVLVGADVQGQPNFMTAAFVTITNVKPPMLVCGLNPSHHTCVGIETNRAFSVCVPSQGMMQVVDWCGIHSGKQVDKGGEFTVFRGDLKGAPMIEQCPMCAECRLVQSTPYGLDSLYVAEIVSVHAHDEYLTEDMPDWEKIAPLLFTFPAPLYWKLGTPLAKAWHVGKGYKPRKP